MPVLAMVARDELVEVGARERLLLQREVQVGAQVVDPQPVFVHGVLARRLAIEEQHVRLDALRVEDAGRQAQQRVDIALVQELTPTVSPAPPSNSTLSGTTTAAQPWIARIVLMCWTKLSCLLLVEVQKSSRTMICDSRLASPSSLTKVTHWISCRRVGWSTPGRSGRPDRRPGCWPRGSGWCRHWRRCRGGRGSSRTAAPVVHNLPAVVARGAAGDPTARDPACCVRPMKPASSVFAPSRGPDLDDRGRPPSSIAGVRANEQRSRGTRAFPPSSCRSYPPR